MPSGDYFKQKSETFWSRRDGQLRRLYASGKTLADIAREIYGANFIHKVSPVNVRNRLIKLGSYTPCGRGVRYTKFSKADALKAVKILASSSVGQVAAVYNMDRNTFVRNMRRHIPGFDSRVIREFWTPKRIEELRVYYFDENHTIQECMRHFGNTSIQNV